MEQARCTWQYLWLMTALEPEHGVMWLRQGDADTLGLAPGTTPMSFDRWNEVLNRLGRDGWEVCSNEFLPDDDARQQLWLLRREA